MATWDEVREKKWSAMTSDEQAEYLALAPEVRAELDAAELVYEARSAAGLTQADLAARMGIRQGCVSVLERGEWVPTVSTLARVVEATGKRLQLTLL